ELRLRDVEGRIRIHPLDRVGGGGAASDQKNGDDDDRERRDDERNGLTHEAGGINHHGRRSPGGFRAFSITARTWASIRARSSFMAAFGIPGGRIAGPTGRARCARLCSIRSGPRPTRTPGTGPDSASKQFAQRTPPFPGEKRSGSAARSTP